MSLWEGKGQEIQLNFVFFRMETSDFIAIAAIIISIGTFFWNEYKDKRDRKEKAFVNLAITFKTSLKFGIAEIGRQLRDENAYGLDIIIAIHNVGNANAVINRIFLMEKNKEGNYDYLKELPIDIESQRIIKSGETLKFYFSEETRDINKLDIKISNQSSFFRVLEASGKVFDSPRD